MKRLFALVILSIALASAPAQNLDDEYVQIFNLIQEADGLSGVQPSQALAKYLEAQKGLQQLQNGSPDWNPKVVAFRLSYVASKITAISPQASVAGATTEPATNAPPGVSAPPATPAAPSDWEAQLNALKEQARQLQTDKGLLEAKLKEALSLQPAESDPRELARAEEKIKALQKENDLLKVTFEEAKSKASVPGVDTKALETVQQSLAESTRQLTQQKELNSNLTLEKEALESRIKQLNSTTAASSVLPAPDTEEPSQVKQLERESDALQKQLEAANKQIYGRKGAVPTPVVAVPTPPTPPTPTAPIAPAAQMTAKSYAVVNGDSFYKIAKVNGISMRALADANPGVDSARLKIGQILQVPASEAAPTAASAPSTALASTTSRPEVLYVVKSGDTLSSIAKAKGTTVKSLKAANGLSGDRILAGTELKIPEAKPAVAYAPQG
jgi:LysM repeat protein